MLPKDPPRPPAAEHTVVPESASVASFWDRFCAASGTDPASPHDCWPFGDSEEMADQLLALVLSGRKRATAGAVLDLQASGEPIPAPGSLSIIVDGRGQPACVIRTEAVDIRPFREVDADFAAAEGEGDGTLTDWRRGHAQFFARRAEVVGFRFDEDMAVVCERFALIYSER